MTTSELVRDLRKAAAEIAAEGHAGWGNLCTLAADELQRLQDEREDAAAERKFNDRE